MKEIPVYICFVFVVATSINIEQERANSVSRANQYADEQIGKVYQKMYLDEVRLADLDELHAKELKELKEKREKEAEELNFQRLNLSRGKIANP